MQKIILCGILGVSMAVNAAIAQDAPVTASLSDRVDKIEQTLAGRGQTALAPTDLQQLQEEIQQLRGMVEVMQNELQKLDERQKALYNDLDGRLTSMQTGSVRQSTSAGFSRQDIVAVVSDEKTAYDQAYQLLAKQKYTEAVAAFEKYVKDYPNGEYIANGYYWLGEAQTIANDLDDARKAFQTVIDKYPESPKAKDAMLKLGFVYEDAGQYDKALQVLEQVSLKYPDTQQAQLARQHIQQIKNISR